MKNHLIQTNDKLMKLAGMQLFDFDELQEFSDTHQKNNQFTQYITIHESGQLCEPEELYSGILQGSGEILRWSDDSRDYSLKEINSYPVYDDSKTDLEWVDIANNLYLREKYRHEEDSEDYFLNYSFNLDQATELVEDVINSSSGCAVWHPKLYYVMQGVGVKEFYPRMSMYLIDKNKMSTNQEIASYSPFIADIPTTKGGFRYGATETEKREEKDGIASYRLPIEGGRNNPDNLRAGELDLTYNEVTGKFEAGTKQVLVRLTTDIEGVNAPGFDPETVHSLTEDQVYKKDAEFNQIGDWTKENNIGSGIPINIQKSNPYLFGPNYISKFDSENKEKKEEIRITNRTPRKFIANQLVLCSYIDGEWIPFDLGQDGAQAASFGVQRWQFQKLIASSDHYFRDKRYLDQNATEEQKQRIDPQGYESLTRNRFYINLKNYIGSSSGPVPAGGNDVSHLTAIDANIFDSIGYMNLGNSDTIVAENELPKNWDFLPSSGYIQVTAFDQMGDFAGGKNSANVIARTNIDARLDTSTEDSDPIDKLELIEYWGPTFPRGFNAEDVSSLSQARTEVTLKAMPEFGSSHPFFFQDGNTEFVANTGNPALVDNIEDRNVSLINRQGMFANSRDRSALNLPAEVGTNGPPGQERSSPIEGLQYLDFGTSNENINLLDGFKHVFKEDEDTGFQERFNWLYKYDDSDPLSGIMNPVYGFRPNAANSIDFYPLAAEVVGSTDYNRGGTSPEFGVGLEFGMLNLMRRIPQISQGIWHHDNGGAVDHLLGTDSIFIRNGEGKVPFIQWGTTGFSSGPDPSKLNYTISYAGYVQNRANGSNNISLPEIWPTILEENASCVGVIAAKTRISFRGTELRFKLDQQFGLQMDTRATLGSAGSFSFLPLGGGLGLPLIGGGTTASSNSYPRWGGVSNDNVNSFNTTALHVKIYDAWPEDQTVFDARYFGVLHFNPGKLLSKPTLSEELLELTDRDGNDIPPFYPDVLTEEVDFKVPTYINNDIISLGTIINGNDEFAKFEHWRVNTIRRGMMLTGGGFNYYRSVCGVNQYHIESGGVNYVQDEILQVTGGSGATVKVSVDEITGEVTSLIIEESGEGFRPEDFGDPLDPLTSKVSLTGGSGSGIDIRFVNGIISFVEEIDEGPKNRSGGEVRLTSKNNNGAGTQGTGFVEDATEQFIAMEDQNDNGFYDMFFHFHNDITHTVHHDGGRMLILPQRVSMEIGAL